MKKILFVNSCLRNDSRTLKLADEVLKYLNQPIETIDLNEEKTQPLTKEDLSLRESLIEKGDFSSFDNAKKVIEADKIVIAAPCWDLTFPAVLKAFIESIMIRGYTFDYSEYGVPQGKCKADELIFVTTSGGPFKYNGLGADYLKHLAQDYLGIENFKLIYADNLDVITTDVDKVLNETIKEIPKILGKKCNGNL